MTIGAKLRHQAACRAVSIWTPWIFHDYCGGLFYCMLIELTGTYAFIFV